MDSKENKAMNENINLLEILKGIPDGTKLWSPICGECELVIVDTLSEYPIKVSNGKDGFLSFLSDGRYVDCIGGECLLFPSKQNRNWSTFKAPWRYKHFEAFQKVLVAVDYLKDESYVGKIWCADLYGHYDKKSHTHYLVGFSGMTDEEIIPYEGNEYKLGKQIE